MKYEYDIVSRPILIGNVKKLLNEWAEHGWEPIDLQSTLYITFRREAISVEPS